MLDRVIAADRVSARQVDTLADVLVDFFRRAATAALSEAEYVARFEREQALNRELLTQARFGLPQAQALLDRMDAALRVHDDALRERVRRARVLEGHGDLRPEQVCLVEPPVLIVRLAVEPRAVDPFDELMSLGLECTMLGASWIAPQLVARCAVALGERPPRALLPLYEGWRALRRARLVVASGAQALAKPYLAQAELALDALARMPALTDRSPAPPSRTTPRAAP
jgi:aminoglycoside phosphotransferase family enzyme